MAVYVDEIREVIKTKKWPYKFACHLFADSRSELMKFADRLGLKRWWLQNKPHLLHFDLTVTMRARAIKQGAIEVDKDFVVKTMRENLKKGGD